MTPKKPFEKILAVPVAASRTGTRAGHAGLACAYLTLASGACSTSASPPAARHLGIGCLRIIAVLLHPRCHYCSASLKVTSLTMANGFG